MSLQGEAADVTGAGSGIGEPLRIDGRGAVNVVHLIYRNKFFEDHYKDFELSADTMGEQLKHARDTAAELSATTFSTARLRLGNFRELTTSVLAQLAAAQA